jgi:hypothetical protein
VGKCTLSSWQLSRSKRHKKFVSVRAIHKYMLERDLKSQFDNTQCYTIICSGAASWFKVYISNYSAFAHSMVGFGSIGKRSEIQCQAIVRVSSLILSLWNILILSKELISLQSKFGSEFRRKYARLSKKCRFGRYTTQFFWFRFRYNKFHSG